MPDPDPTPPAPPPTPAPTPDKMFTQADLDRVLSERLSRDRQTRQAEFDQLKAKADSYDALAAASQTDQQRAVAEATAAATADARKLYGGRAVQAELRARLTGRVSDAQRDAIVAGANHGAYVNDKGEIDETALQAWVDQIAPAQTAPNGPPGRGLGGYQPPNNHPSSAEAGLAEARRRGHIPAPK